MESLLLAAYVLLPLVTLWRTRSLAWTVVMVVASVSVLGLFVGFWMDLGHTWTRSGLQLMLLAALVLPVVIAFVRRPVAQTPMRRQFLAIGVPFLGLGALLALVMVKFATVSAFLTPVSFLMGHAMAEDNAKWLDFTSQLATGLPVVQGVAMGGPLQLFLVFVATAMGVVSQVVLGGYNEVAVAANSVIVGQYFMVVLAPLAFAPFVEAWVRRPTGSTPNTRTRIPLPLIWLGITVLASTVLLATAYGHLTWQYTALITTLWSAVFLASSRIPRAQLLTSMAVAAGMTVWLPMNAIAALLIVGWLVVIVGRGINGRGIKGGRPAMDWLGLGLVVLVTVCIYEPLRSSVAFVLGSSPASASGLGSGAGGIQAGFSAVIPRSSRVPAGLSDSTLFSAGGGTEQTTAILAILAATLIIGAAVFASRQPRIRWAYIRLLPVLILAGFAVLLNLLDQWATGSAPHYGSLKFTFLAAIVAIASCVPVALLLIDPAGKAMTLGRWVAIAAVVFVLIVDSLLLRSVAAARPQQWSPAIPFDNPKSYWWPADVNGTGTQTITNNPVGCVYLPQGAKVPSAILDSELSDPQRVYSCTRLLAGLAGQDATAQPLVDWLRREWLTNTRAWSDVYGYLNGMPAEVKAKQMILLDDGSNVIGLESVQSLLERYPASAGQATAP